MSKYTYYTDRQKERIIAEALETEEGKNELYQSLFGRYTGFSFFNSQQKKKQPTLMLYGMRLLTDKENKM